TWTIVFWKLLNKTTILPNTTVTDTTVTGNLEGSTERLTQATEFRSPVTVTESATVLPNPTVNYVAAKEHLQGSRMDTFNR
ncbi:Uncharacterized protein DAT39_015780, partial [Clarias magur]